MQKSETHPTGWQEWTLIGLHGLYVLAMMGIIYLLRATATNNTLTTVAFDDLLMVGGLGLGVIALLMSCTFVAALRPGLPYATMIGDWALVGAFLFITNTDPVLMIGIIGPVLVLGVLYLGMPLGPLHTTGILAMAAGLLIYTFGAEQLDLIQNTYTAPALVTVVLALVCNGWAYVRSTYDQSQRIQLRETARQRAEQLEAARERSRAITDMTTTLASTLNFDKIVDATLNIGLLSLRQRPNQRVVSMMLLFRSSDDALYIVNSRGLNRTDDHKIIHGKAGIVAQTLDECIPIIGKNASEDPELRSLAAFRNIRSVLCIPLRAHYDNYGVLLYGSDQSNAFEEDHIDMLKAMGVQATVALQNAVLYTNLMAEKERIIQMEEDARKALVRDLHDIPTQTISAVAMRIRIIMRELERNPEVVPKELQLVEEMTLRATEEIRHVLFKLRPLALESQGLAAALEQLAEKMEKTYQQKVAVRVGRDVERYLDVTKQGALFYLIEEAVNNARKYAEAELVKVQVGRQKDAIIARISDNGVGFDMQAVENGYDNRGSFGMVNMRERAELMDGTLSLKSIPGRGTTITVHIPIDTSQPAEDGYAPSSHIPTTKLAASARSTLQDMGR